MTIRFDRPLPRLVARWVPEKYHPLSSFLIDVISNQRGLIIPWVLVNVGASMLEGASMGVLYLALNALMGKNGTDFSQTAGWMGGMADRLAGYMDRYTLFLLLIGIVALTQVLQSGFRFAGTAVSSFLRIRIRRALYKGVFSHILSINFSVLSRYKTGELWTYISISKQFDALIANINNFLYTTFLMIAYVVVLMWLSWSMTLAALVFLVVVSLGLRVVMRKVRNTAKTLLSAMVELNNQTVDFLGGIRLIRSFATEDKTKRIIDKHVDKAMDMARRGMIWNGAVSPLVDAVTILFVVAALAGVSMVFGNRIGDILPLLMMFLFVMYRLMPRLGFLNSIRANLHEILPGIIYTIQFLRRDDKPMEKTGGRIFRELRDAIEFRNLSLTYTHDEHPAVQDLSFAIGEGKTVAIVGESGAGKSSVVDLLLGLYEPTEGGIFIDGVPFTEIDRRSFREKIGVVSQDTFLLNASVADNISFAEPDACKEEIIRAAKMAHAHEFIIKLENGYDTIIGNRGFRLSGGQCQRLALARAFIRQPQILILDEATSNLDSKSERLIQEALESFGKDRTVLIVAHRFSTVFNVDEILVMRGGRLIEKGTHDELIAQGGIYAGMWELQTGADLPLTGSAGKMAG